MKKKPFQTVSFIERASTIWYFDLASTILSISFGMSEVAVRGFYSKHYSAKMKLLTEAWIVLDCKRAIKA